MGASGLEGCVPRLWDPVLVEVGVGLHRVPFVTHCDRGCLMFTDVYLTVNLG